MAGDPRNMGKIIFFSFICSCFCSYGQTNTSLAPEHLFLDRAELVLDRPARTLAGAAEPGSADAVVSEKLVRDSSILPAASVTQSDTNSIPEEMVLSSRERDFNRQIYRRLEEAGYLSKPDPPSGNLLVRATDAIFQPEVVQVGKRSVSCSIITAIKRKNPLCLLNPIFLNASW
jgi:hypothetical protein